MCSQIADRVTSVPRCRTISSRIEYSRAVKLDRHVLAIHQPRRPVDRDIADDEHRRGIASGSPYERAKACHELGDGERLRQIIVGAKVERLDAIVDGVERGQNQNRRTRPRLPQILQKRPAAALRHHQVEHDRIVGDFVEHELRFVPIRSDVDGKVRLVERTAQCAGQIGLILDDEHSHGFLIAAGGVSSVSSSMRKSSNMTVESPPVQSPTLALARGRRSRSVRTRMPPRYTRISPRS